MKRPCVVNGILYGIGLSVVLGVLILGSLRLFPKLWASSYPPDIRARVGPLSRPERRTWAILALLAYACVVVALWLAIRSVPGLPGGAFTFPQIFVTTWVVLNVFNLVDWLILDWIILLTLRPRWAILPGTDEDMAGYHDYAFHFRAFLIGLVITTLASAIVAGLALLMVRLVP